MDYDFDTIVSRIGTNSTKWDRGEDILPMWVADMDFKTSPEIISDLKIELTKVFLATLILVMSGRNPLFLGGEEGITSRFMKIGFYIRLGLFLHYLH